MKKDEQENEIKSLDELIEKVRTYIKDEEEINTIVKAYDYSLNIHKGNKRLCGEDYILHPLNVAYILTDLYADSDTLATALMHDVITKGGADIEDIKKKFSPEIVSLLEGVTKINKLSLSAENESTVNYYKKILIGLTEDVRIIILKLAERVHNMRTLWAIPEEKRAEKAKETLEILAPIAHRLGLSEIKTELEVLSLKYYKPAAYLSVEQLLDNTEEEREQLVLEMKKRVSELLMENNINFEIKGRAKSIYSIYNKMQKGKKFSEIYDLYALRIIVDTETECYQVLGLIHSKFKPLPKRFKDYIANPKNNMYQSLHTTVFGYGDKHYEIQIRTHKMDEIAERGIASHWSYKEQGKKIQNSMEQKLQIFRSIMELNSENLSAEDFVNTAKDEILGNSIYVYTPKGDVFELPKGSTPIDFAYRVHTKIGETMVGAIVNENIVPLNTELKSGDIIKINTNKNSAGPSKEWINMAKTNSAKSKIKAFFSKIDKKEAYDKGKELFLKEIRRKKLSVSDVTDKIAIILKELKIADENEMYLGIGTGKYNPNSVINLAFKDDFNKEEYIIDKIINKDNIYEDVKNDVLVDGIDEIKVTLANCCKPIKGDEIVGYISTGNGVIVHHKDCKNLRDMPNRLINVSWNENTQRKFNARISIVSENKENLLLEILTKASPNNISINGVNTNKKDNEIIYDLKLEVPNLEKLKKFMLDLNHIQSIKEVKRIFG